MFFSLTEKKQAKRRRPKSFGFMICVRIKILHKINPLQYEDLKDFIKWYNPKNRFKREKAEKFRAFTCDELMQMNKVCLDIFWLKDESIEHSEDLLNPYILTREIAENLELALE